MKIDAYDANNKKIELEIYKVQLATFGSQGVYIHNEDKTEVLEITNRKEIKAIADLVQGKLESYVAGKYNNETGDITLMHILPNKNYF